MAFPGSLPVDPSKHRGHPLKSFSIPAPPSNTPLIPNQKPGKMRKPTFLIIRWPGITMSALDFHKTVWDFLEMLQFFKFVSDFH